MFINKRILIALCAIGVLIVGGLGVTIFLLLNQSSASASNLAVTPTPTLTVTATPRLSVNHTCATGVISSIDPQAQTFVVTEKGAKTVTVTTDTKTTYHERGATGMIFGSLKVGQHVRITSQSACDSTATTVTAKAITIVVPGATSTATSTPTP